MKFEGDKSNLVEVMIQEFRRAVRPLFAEHCRGVKLVGKGLPGADLDLWKGGVKMN